MGPKRFPQFVEAIANERSLDSKTTLRAVTAFLEATRDYETPVILDAADQYTVALGTNRETVPSLGRWKGYLRTAKLARDKPKPNGRHRPGPAARSVVAGAAALGVEVDRDD